MFPTLPHLYSNPRHASLTRGGRRFLGMMFLLQCCAMIIMARACIADQESLPSAREAAGPQSRIRVALLGFANQTGDSDSAGWALTLLNLVEWRLQDVKAVHLLPDVTYGLRQLNITNGSPADAGQARDLGKLIGADWVVSGGDERQGKDWLVRVWALDVATGAKSKELTIISSDWNEIGDRLTENILKELGVNLNGAERQKMLGHKAISTAVLEQYARFPILQSLGRPLTELEECVRQAIKADPAFGEAYVTLAMLLTIEGKAPEAEEAARTAVNLRPNYAEAHKWLGIVFASEAKVQEAEKEFLTAVQLDADDAETFMDLGSLHGQEGRYSDAVNEFSKAIELNPHADFIAAAKDRLALSRARLNTTHVHPIHFVPPQDYTESTLTEALRQKLTPEELKLVVNPLASTPEMDRWARMLTADATNDEAKAKILFETLAYNAAGENQRSTQVAIRTARDTFAVWNTPGAALNCQDYEYLYVALARAVGIRAYAVDVQEDVNGGKIPHACAAVIIDGKGLLVDPTVPWFGAPHKRFTVMDDLQVGAIYLGQLPGLQYSEIASKLAPDVALVQLNLFEKLTAEGRLKEARELLPRLKRLDINEATGDYAEARLALIEGNLESAVELLLKAIAIDPNEGTYHTRLANAYAQEGRLPAARESLQNALRCPMTTAESELPRRLVATTNELAIWGYFGRSVGLQNKGDLDGALKSYDEIIKLNPNLGEAYNNRGMVKQIKGDSKGAKEDFRKAIALNPKLSRSIENH